jgi:hypothetical protein
MRQCCNTADVLSSCSSASLPSPRPE